MLDYVEEDTSSDNLREVLSRLSGMNIEELADWRIDLMQAGFDINSPKQQESFQ